MDISLNEFQLEMGSYMKKILSEDVPTKIARDYINSEFKSYEQTKKKMIEMGVPGILIGEEYGGLGLSQVDLIPVMEEIGRTVYPGNLTETISFLPMLLKEIKADCKTGLFKRILSGNIEIAIAWYETNNKYDNPEFAIEQQDHEIVMNGTKHMVKSSHSVTDYIVMNVTNHREAEIVLVPKEKVTKIQTLKSMDRTLHFENLTFENVRLPKEALITQGEEGYRFLNNALRSLHASLCSQMVGAMDRLLNMSVEYAKIRVQFGHPIGKYQAIKHKLADMKVKLEISRSNSYQANWEVDQMTDQADVIIYGSRALLNEFLLQVAGESIQIHGGIGYTEEFDSHLYLKRAKVLQHYLGDIASWRKIAGKSLKKQMGADSVLCN